MNDPRHQGSRAYGPLSQTPDRRVPMLDDAARFLEAIVPGIGGFAADAQRAMRLVIKPQTESSHTARGVVIHAIPYVNWYKVQMSDGAGWIAACNMSGAGVPIGPREISMVRPNDQVLVYMPAGLNYGIIIGVIPPALFDGSIVCPDWITQGGNSGLRQEPAHQHPITSLHQHGGVIDWSSNRPMDQTSMERGWIAPTGVAITLDDFMIQVRVNEMCGIWATLYDSWMRVAALQLLVESGCHEEMAYDDEGESLYFKGIATYPWEAVGLAAQPGEFTVENSDSDVQFNHAVGKVEAVPNIQPLFRWQEYGGYLGQGYYRALMKPGDTEDINTYNAVVPDEGLFRENVALDGSYSVVSAKRLYFGKRCKISVPKRIKQPEHGQGDDLAASNYKFSGRVGGGNDHVIKDISVNGPFKSMQKVAGARDIIAYAVNWQALHPFHYHQLDFKTWQESEMLTFLRSQETINLWELEFNPFVSDPSPTPLHIDDRYGDVDYFERESFLIFHDDGSVQMTAGAGESIILGGGDIDLQTPGKVKLQSGTDTIVFSDQIVLRAKRSVDISASNNDVSIKAERNLRMLGGDGNIGGVLIESKGRGPLQGYVGAIGEDVISSGIILKAPYSVVCALATDIYLRTGGSDMGSGDIVLDAGKGNNHCMIYAKTVSAFVTDQVCFSFGPIDEDSAVNSVYYFGNDAAAFTGHLIVEKSVVLRGDEANMIVNGDVYATGKVLAGERMADSEGGPIGKVPDGYVNQLQSDLTQQLAGVLEIPTFQRTIHEQGFVQRYYQSFQLGNDLTIPAIQFSFRDSPLSDQYKTANLFWPESYWTMMARLGAMSGGVSWEERPVICQGVPTYPYPGRKKWLEEPIFLQLPQTTMFDPASGIDADRPGPYENPALSDWTAVTMAEGYKLIRSF